ncbi:hypothetical protein Ahy_B08g089108 [Arachis hypogaea]|uniref:CCHC-type domain-containing protein n=1 Tax=Arachis hypogaea TaxID=3818 RepID=A0A444XWQ8_ARAHY|nr:hypothetical protein Ahy_B08g089108 [Arachis hypogaea]
MIELYVEFEQHSGLDAVGEEVNVDEFGDIDWEEDNNDSEEEFEANFEVDDEKNDRDLAGNPAIQNEAKTIVSQHPFGVPSFMWTLDLEAMHAPEFSEYANMSNVAAKDGEFSVGIEFGSRESMISAIKSYTISRGVDYTVYERYNDKHTCTMGTILQDDAKLESDTIADVISPLVEADPSIKIKSIIAEVQSRFNYTVSYRKAWLAKQKSVAKIIGDWKVSYQTLPIMLKTMTAKMSRSRVQIKRLHVYSFGHCKPLVQVDGTHLYGKYRGALLVAIAQDVNKNIVPIAFAIVEGEIADAWEFFLTNLRRYVVIIDGVGIISDRHNSIDAAITHSYSRTEQEYNKNYQRLKEQGEAYTQSCDEIGVQRWVLAFDGGHHWGHMTINLVDYINSVLKGAHNLPMTAIVRSNFYRLNKLFTRKRPRLMSISATDLHIQNLIPKELMKAFDVQEILRVTKRRPKSTRYLNEMDSRDMRGPRWCTICGREGHSRSRCPQRAGPSSAGGQ